jgi:pimeloyl-ACP methyl ester carboxylesterase
MEAGAIELAWDEQGKGDPTLLFVHGWTCDHSHWLEQARHFSAQHRVVMPDLRGHGESPGLDDPISIGTFAVDLAALIERLNLGRVFAIGHSMGGLTVLELAVRFPQHVAAIAMIDPAPFARDPTRRTMVDTLLASIDGGERTMREAFVRGMFPHATDPALVERIVAGMLATPAGVASRAMRAIFDYDAPAAAARCTVPALHIAATPPLNEPHQMSEWLPEVVNGWTVGAGHFNMLEEPAQVNAMLAAFMRRYLDP